MLRVSSEREKLRKRETDRDCPNDDDEMRCLFSVEPHTPRQKRFWPRLAAAAAIAATAAPSQFDFDMCPSEMHFFVPEV